MSNVTPSKFDKEALTGDVKISYRDMPPNDTKNKKRFELPLNYFKDAAKHNILDGLKHCAKPKLFFLGTKDTLIKPENIRATYQASAEPKAIYELNSDHDYRYHENIITEVNNLTGEFLDKY